MRRKTEPTERHPPRPSRRGGKGGARELSITTLFRASHRARSGEAPVPNLRISGRWLEQYGLTRGSRVVVSGEAGEARADGRAVAGTAFGARLNGRCNDRK
ncbi:MAG TPA: SymE family type I addiction module toxin [Thermoanaerobaculia bacterium]